MNIVIMTPKRGCSGLLTLNRRWITTIILSIFIVLPVSFIVVGYRLGVAHMKTHPDDLSLAMHAEMDAQRLALSEATRSARDNMDALALRLGKLQAHVIRLDALGQRLTTMAKLDKGEFNFNRPPAQGGPLTDPAAAKTIDVPDFMKSLEDLSAQLDDRGQQLEVLEDMLMTRNLQSEVVPTGRPIRKGWLSSYFGMRTDPFTGRQAFHSGIDFAGKMGSHVISVAAGVVTFAGWRSGYGNLVEVNHGKGYLTRYGHNSKILVRVGQTVKKGEVISLMGSTGRSTGPHVHFEVLYNGHAVDPLKYIQAASR